jgi:hypothetical protein
MSAASTPFPAILRRAARAALATLVLLGAAIPAPRGQAEGAPAAGRRLVLLILGGGVRASDVLDGATMPQVKALAAEGCVVDRIASPRENAYLACRDLLTGSGDQPGGAGRPPPGRPTLFERLRASPGARAEDAWLVSAAGEADLPLAASTYAGFGPSLGARVARGDGAFGEPLKTFLEAHGRPLPVAEQVWPLLRRLREVNRRAAGQFLPDDLDAGTASAERVERAVLRELDRKAALVKAPSPADERALRAALTLIAVHRPRLLVVRLTGAEAGQQSEAAYLEALRHADRGLERLRAAVREDPVAAAQTSFAVVTECGRNAKADAAGALFADEESDARRHAVLVAAGPGWKPGARVKGARALVDVGATLGRWLGLDAAGPGARVWDALLAE